tara:strand:+ start:227 stop:1138 length:912 start_codon:yes stop_codon:yes gene_type:complete
MATLNEIAYNIKNLAYGGSATINEESMNIKQIKFWIHSYRAQLIQEDSMSGKGVDHAFYQELLIRRTMDRRMAITEWETYVNANSNASEMLVYSDRTAALALVPSGRSIDHIDYYGRDFYDYHTSEEGADYGNMFINLPDLIHVDKYGIKNLRLRKSQTNYNQNTSNIDVPIVSENEGRNKKYNRFSSKSPAAYIMNSAENMDVLVIANLNSILNNTTNGYGNPIQYRVYASALYSDPTKFDHQNTGVEWNDDMQYPIPETLIPELNKRILQQEFNITKQTTDDRVDDNIDTTNVQQKVQRQV